MRRPYAAPATTARPDIGLPEPRLSRFAIAAARALSGPYLRLVLGFERVEFRHVDILVEAFRGALAGDDRLLIAFRHPYGDEPQLLGWACDVGLGREARRLGSSLPRRGHAVFVHGYEVPRWGGPLIRWLLPRVGAMPVHHAKLDYAGMNRILAAIENGPYPLALSPEGQVGYSSETVPRLEQGAIRLGFQAAERLARTGRPGRVLVLPVSVHYRYGRRAAASLGRLVQRIEAFVGGDAGAAGRAGDLGARLGAARASIVSAAAIQYGLPAGADVGDIVDAALDTGERLLGIGRGPGDAIERVYRIRQIGWDRVFLPPGDNPRRMAPLARAVADRRAGEAWYAMRHMELADFAWYFRGDPPGGDPPGGDPPGGEAPFHAVAEYAQNLWDFANRLAGGAFDGRVSVRPRRAILVAAPAIDLCARLGEWRADRKAAAAGALAALESSYMQCIKEIRDEN